METSKQTHEPQCGKTHVPSPSARHKDQETLENQAQPNMPTVSFNLLTCLLFFFPFIFSVFCWRAACPFMSISLLFSWPISDGQCWRPSYSLAYVFSRVSSSFFPCLSSDFFSFLQPLSPVRLKLCPQPAQKMLASL